MPGNGVEQYDHWNRSGNRWNHSAAVPDPADQRAEMISVKRYSYNIKRKMEVVFMAKSKLVEKNEKIAEKVVGGYKKN